MQEIAIVVMKDELWGGVEINWKLMWIKIETFQVLPRGYFVKRNCIILS